MASESRDCGEVSTGDYMDSYQHTMTLSDSTCINISTLPSPMTLSAAVDECPSQAVTPPVLFDDRQGDSCVDQSTLHSSSSTQTYTYDDDDVQTDTAAAAAADAMTSQTITRCSCDVGCPCCGRCVQSSSSWSPLPASSISALRDVDSFIARYRVSSPPPLITSPSKPITWMSPVSTEHLQTSLPVLASRTTDDFQDLKQPVENTSVEELLQCQSNIDSYNSMHQQRDEYISQTDAFPEVAASTVYSDTSLEQWRIYASSPLGVSLPPASCAPITSSWNIDGHSLNERGSTTDSDIRSNVVGDFSTHVSESSFLPTDSAVPSCSVESDPPRTSVITLAQQLDVYWAQRSETLNSSHPAVQQPFAVKPVSRPTAPPPAPPGLLTSTNGFDRSPTYYDQQLTTQTLPRASSTRSLQAAPPRPPPRSTTQESNNTSTWLGQSLHSDMQTGFDRTYHGTMSTFQGQRTLNETGGQGGLSGSVQSLPGCDVTSTSLATSRGRPAPQPPRRGSSMSPRLQAKSTRYGGRARSASLRSNNDDVDADVLLRMTSNSSTGARQLDGSTINMAAREPARQATVSGQKPVAQIRPHAIRSPSASSVTRQRLNDDDSKCSVAARTYIDQQSSVETNYSADTQSLTVTTSSVSSDRQSETSGNTSVSRFGTLRSRIKDYVTAAASVGANRKQAMTSSSSFADWTLPRGRPRRSSSATSWEPDRSDYASAGREPSRGTSFDDSGPWSSSYFGVFPGPRPLISPRTRATEVSLPQNIVASADNAMSAGDVTSTITSRISTFLTFLGGSRRPADSDTTPQPASTSTVINRTGTELPLRNFGDTKTHVAKAVVDPVVSTLERRSRSVSGTPPVRSASTSEVLAKAAAAAAAAARDARGRQPLRFVREQRATLSTFRTSGSLNVARSSSFSPQSTSSTTNEAQQSVEGFQLSDGRRTSKSGTVDNSTGQISQSSKHLSALAYQSAPSTPLDWHDGKEGQHTVMMSSLPVDSSAIRPPLIDHSPEAGDVVTDLSKPRTTSVPLSVFRQVDVEVERLIELLQNAALPDDSPSRRDTDAAQIEAARESLLALTRQFVDDSQRLVSGATRSVDALVAGVEPSLITLTRLTGECRSTATILTSPSQGVMLVGRVRDLAQAYRSTVSAARSAVGRPFNSVEMKSLMRQATSLAAILSSLIKMLNRTDIIC